MIFLEKAINGAVTEQILSLGSMELRVGYILYGLVLIQDAFALGSSQALTKTS